MSASSPLVDVALANGTSMRVLPEVHAMRDEIVAHRRWFHMHPEIAFKEHLTAARVAETLAAIGIASTDIFTGVGGTGVVALICGGGAEEGPCVALRADMDALPVLETAEVEYKR